MAQFNGCQICGSPHPSANFTSVCHYCSGLKQAPYSTFVFPTPSSFFTEPSPPKVLPKENSTTLLVGYRVWNLDRKECKLTSTFKKQFSWPFRKPLSKDGINDMGIHAMKSGKYILESPPRSSPSLFSEGNLWDSYKADVAGSVYLWGEVQEHSHGYLAEFAYPKELWMPENSDPLTVMQLEWNYGVPVTLRADLKYPHNPDEFPRQWVTYKFSYRAFASPFPTTP